MYALEGSVLWDCLIDRCQWYANIAEHAWNEEKLVSYLKWEGAWHSIPQQWWKYRNLYWFTIIVFIYLFIFIVFVFLVYYYCFYWLIHIYCICFIYALLIEHNQYGLSSSLCVGSYLARYVSDLSESIIISALWFLQACSLSLWPFMPYLHTFHGVTLEKLWLNIESFVPKSIYWRC